MKDKQGKHDHKLTKLLKFGLFATLMVAPLFAVLFKCMYVTINKNAYQSYSQEVDYKYTSNEVNNADDLISGNIYTFTINQAPSTNEYFSSFKAIYNIKRLNNYNFNFEAEGNDVMFLNITSSNITIRSQNYSNIFSINNSEITFPYSFDVVLYSYSPSTNFTYENLSKSDYNLLTANSKNAYLDNAFYYSVEEMQNNTLFNWTQSTAIYTPIDAMTNGIGISTDAVAILLTYWLYLTLIYIVIDIVVELFTWMTHTLLGKPIG